MPSRAIAAGFPARLQDRHHGRATDNGFTIIEVMIVLVVLAILGAVAAPAMTSMLRTSKVRTIASDFYSALLKARSESIKRRVDVTVAPAGTSWNAGWTVKYGTTTLINHEALASDVGVQINVPASSTAASIVYGSNGRVSSAAPTLIFYASSDASVQARCVSADPAGLPRVRTDTNGDATDGCN